MPRFALVCLVLAAMLAGCGATEPGPHARAETPSRSVTADGVSLELPPGWDGYARRLGDENAVIWAASRPFVEPLPRPAFPHETLGALARTGIAVEIAVGTPPPGSASWPLRTSVSLADGYFLADGYEGQPAAGVSTQIIRARIANRVLWVQVYFGRTDPDAAMRASADRVLGSLFRPREVRAGGDVRFDDPATGVSGRYPAGWHRARALTNVDEPREVLALATYPLRTGAEGGECAPATARDDMPPDGTFIWLLEYRHDALVERASPRPAHFAIGRRNLVPATEDLDCFPRPGYRADFRVAGRAFELFVAFGQEPTTAQLDAVNGILDSLAFEPQPVPPPDPYAGWPSVNDNPGDSLRPPPGWPASAAMFRLDTPRPRALFFASNRPLTGLPQELVPYVRGELPGPFPSAALANFPADGVLLWVSEEPKGVASSQFPPIGRDWPERADFRDTVAPAEPAPGVRWLRAGGSFGGSRFLLWIAAGPKATGGDLELAMKSGASLAVSSCPRDAEDACPGQ